MSSSSLLEEVQRLRRENSALKMSLNEYRRYGRQMQVPEVGIDGQVALLRSKILVIGAGGLGSPALLYLAGAGVGQIGIVDPDTVDVTNLHRQVIHDTSTVGLPKCESAKLRILALNPRVQVDTYYEPLTNLNSFEIVQKYDVVLDCTDNPATRYLVNDTCVLLGKTLVSGSGLKTEGQLSVLNFQNTGPCYRCFYPTPPPPESVTSCSDGGVVGPCIGLVGVMMVVEAIKVVTGFYTAENFKPYLSLYNGYSPQQKLRTFKMRGRRDDCKICTGEITRADIEEGRIDYHSWCGSINYDVVDPSQKISPGSLTTNPGSVIIDVRPKEQYEISHLPKSINVPYTDLKKKIKEGTLPDLDGAETVYVICRRGRDSQLATKLLEQQYPHVIDVAGGLECWKQDVDPDFPAYW